MKRSPPSGIRRNPRILAAGETLRELARDYAVAHTTLGRYFARPEVAKELRRAEQQLRAEQRAAEARWRAEQKATREAERRATQQAEEERRARLASHPEAERQPSRHARRRRAASLSPSPARRASGGPILRPAHPRSYADWLDERDARLPAPRIAPSGS